MQTSRIWRFAAFELDEARFELRRNGRPLRIERIPMELLTLLIARGGELVSRQEIVEAVWGEGIHVDAEQGVNTAIRKLRHVLRDDAESPKYIQTVVGKGYRFIAEVTEAAEKPADEHKAVESPSPVRPPRRWAWSIGALGIGLALIALAVGSHRSPPKSGPSLAVLPFENLTGDKERQYLADGITEETIAVLGRLSPERLKVVARTSAMAYLGTRKSVNQIGSELGVDLVLESSLREESGRVRITTQLIRVSDQMHLWAQSYDAELSSVITMQADVASAIAKDVQLNLSPERKAGIHADRSVGPEAYHAYLRGRYFWNLRDEASLEKANEYFQQAVGLSPDFSDAYAGLADTQSMLAYGNYRAPTETFSKARMAAERALQLDPESAEAHASMGYVRFYFDWDFAGAESELRRAIELNANHAMAHDWLGYVLTARSRFADAGKEFRTALDLDPLSVPVRTDTGFGLHYAGDNRRAIRELESALEMNPRFPFAHFWLGRAYGAVGDCETALAELNASEPALRSWQPLLAAKGHFLGKCGHQSEAEQLLGRFAELSKSRYVTSYGVALIQSGLGRGDEALQALERAFEERSHWLVWLALDPRFEDLRSRAAFRDLVNRIGLQ